MILALLPTAAFAAKAEIKTVAVTVEIKPGVDAKFVKETSIKATINGESKGMMKKRKSDTQVVLTYTIMLKDPDADAKKAAAEAIGSTNVPESYDTFDYRAYANVYYMLRDLGQKLGFNVGWSAEKGVFIETGRPYTDTD